MSEWISVKDKLPNELDDVLIYGPNIVITKAFLLKNIIDRVVHREVFYKAGWMISDSEEGNSIDSEHVTHWMPLPEPPKDIKEE